MFNMSMFYKMYKSCDVFVVKMLLVAGRKKFRLMPDLDTSCNSLRSQVTQKDFFV